LPETCREVEINILRGSVDIVDLIRKILYWDARSTKHKKKYIFPLSKKGTTQKISILQEKQESGSVLHMTNAVTGRIYPTYTGYSCRWSCHIFTCHRGPLVERFATHNSIYFKVAVSLFF